MPNLTVEVAADRPPVVGRLVATNEALRDAGLTVPLPILLSALLDMEASASTVTRGVAEELGRHKEPKCK
jgi:hypothetical protein